MAQHLTPLLVPSSPFFDAVDHDTLLSMRKWLEYVAKTDRIIIYVEKILRALKEDDMDYQLLKPFVMAETPDCAVLKGYHITRGLVERMKRCAEAWRTHEKRLSSDRGPIERALGYQS